MKKYFNRTSIFIACVLVYMICAPDAVWASTTATYAATSGSDASSGMPRAFTIAGTKSDIVKLAAPDNKRIQSDAVSWPISETFEEDKYIEFVFAPSIPVGAAIEHAAITHEFRRSGSLGGVKLEVWDGLQFADFLLTIGAQNTDHSETIDVTSLLNTPEKIHMAKARFLAYRGDGKTKTSHDYIGLAVTYFMPDIANPQDPPDPGESEDVADDPVAEDQYLATSVDTPLTIVLSGIDPKGEALSYAATSMPSKGMLGALAGNQIVYTPSGTIGEDSFSYTASDSSDTSKPAVIHIINTAGALHSISIDASSTVAKTGETVQVSIYGEDQFGNVPPDTIQSSATGDAVLDAVAGNITKPTPGTATISASSGNISAVPIDIVWSDPVQEQIDALVPPEEPVVLRSSSGHPPVSEIRNTVSEPGSVSEKTDTPKSLLVETVAVEILEIPRRFPYRRQVSHPFVSPETTYEDINEIIAPEMLAATAGSAYPIDRRLVICVILLILFLAICWRIYRYAKKGHS